MDGKDALEQDVTRNPDQYSFWFKIILQKLSSEIYGLRNGSYRFSVSALS